MHAGKEIWRSYAGRRLDPTRPTGLLLAGMGGPDDRDSVEPFLRNLFDDPAVLSLPRFIARFLGGWIVRKRLARVQERYASLGHGGGSPQLEWTRRQGAALESRLAEHGLNVKTGPAMRYWHPYADESVRALRISGAEQFAILPLYPHYAGATSGSSLDDACRAVRTAHADAPLSVLSDWHLLPGYLDALAEFTADGLNSWTAAGAEPERCGLLYAAHALPERFVRAGDPYVAQTMASVAAVHLRLCERLAEHGDWLSGLRGGSEPLLAFQSKLGPVKWVGPSLRDEARRLAEAGCERIFVQPISFSCEHIETLYELDVELAAFLCELGVSEFKRGPALGLHGGWLDSLAALIIESCFVSGAREEVAHVD